MKKFQIYKSSAGSGKTYTLVKAYLKIVLRKPDQVKHILAITFTNAAATEMKTRIIRELGSLSSLPENPSDEKTKRLLAQIRDEWQQEYGEALSEAKTIEHAQIALKYILHRYADFAVSTIDSFAHRLIRSFAFDLYLPFHFDVELDADALISKAADILISRAGSDDTLTNLLLSFILGQADEEKNLNIEHMISTMGKSLMEEDGFLALEKLRGNTLSNYNDIAIRIATYIRDYEKSVRGIAQEALAMIADKGLAQTSFFRGSTGIVGYFDKLSKQTSGPVATPNSYVRTTIDEQKWFSPKASSAEKQAISDISGKLEDACLRITGHNDVLINIYKVYREIRKHIYPVAVLNELDAILQSIREENVLLHISDFNKKIAAVIAEQPVPFIYERLGELYHHYMVDEFQDTSALQWYNLLPLFDNALASGHMSLVVGDGKQAIYRFRNGDVEQFAALPRLSETLQQMARPEWEQTLVANAQTNSLQRNFRSLPEIVQFNNTFFESASSVLSEALKQIYAETAQQSLDNKLGGFVEISFLDADATPQNSDQDTSGDNPGASTDDSQVDDEPGWENANLRQITCIIDRLQTAGHPLSDIAILCRARKEASLVSRTLLENGIPVISAESLLLNQSDDVNFIISLIRLTENPGNQVAAVEVVTYLYKNSLLNIPDTLHECLKKITGIKKKGRAPGINYAPAIEAILLENDIRLSFSGFRHQNVYDICETIVSTFFSSPPPNAFIAFFSDAVFDYAEKNTLTTADFLTWWDANNQKFSLIVPPGIEAIQVLTIHKSKGLQYPVVIAPFTDHNMGKITKNGSWVDLSLDDIPELKTSWVSLSKTASTHTPFESLYIREVEKSYLDALNMIYVAFTRAENKLFILTKKSNTYKNNTAQGLLHDYLVSSGLWDDAVDTYTFGGFASPDMQTPAKHTGHIGQTAPASGGPFPSEENSGALKADFREILSQPWNRALKVKSHQAATNTDASGYEFLERGNLLHRAMERIRAKKDIDTVLEQMYLDGDINAERKSEWAQKIKKMIDLPMVAPYFAEDVPAKSEAGIFDSHGSYFRPDRVVLLENETVLLDYKTGQQYDKHKVQMASYASLLRQMGYPDVKSMLLYLDSGEVVNC